MKVKYGSRWYDVLDVEEIGGLERYKVVDENGDVDWIANPDEIVLDEE